MPTTTRTSAEPLITASFTISPRGPFSLAEAATFGFGQRDGRGWDGVMRLAFCLDGYAVQAAAEVRQDDGGDVHLAVFAPSGTDLAAVRDQTARVLSLDHDATEFARLGDRDPVIARLQAVAPGLRPPLFHSPYEAAAWSVLSARRPARAMMHIRALLSEAHGRTFDLAGQRLAAFPTPSQLLRVDSFPGVGPDKIERLHGVARAALEGRLDVSTLKDLGPDAAMAELQAIKGIGPFYSALVVIRGTGFTDVLPVNEPRLLALTASLYNLPEPPAPDEFQTLAEPWRPFRTWTAVLIRAAATRLLPSGAMPVTERAFFGNAGVAVAPVRQRGVVLRGESPGVRGGAGVMRVRDERAVTGAGTGVRQVLAGHGKMKPARASDTAGAMRSRARRPGPEFAVDLVAGQR